MTRFLLIHGDTNETFGRISFNGKFVFELNEDIDVAYWNKIGFIKLDDQAHRVESDDLFAHLNARLPITLRNESNQRKLQYIKDTGLRVASDSFYLSEVEDTL